jgi:hypothetical protein
MKSGVVALVFVGATLSTPVGAAHRHADPKEEILTDERLVDLAEDIFHPERLTDHHRIIRDNRRLGVYRGVDVFVNAAPQTFVVVYFDTSNGASCSTIGGVNVLMKYKGVTNTALYETFCVPKILVSEGLIGDGLIEKTTVVEDVSGKRYSAAPP